MKNIIKWLAIIGGAFFVLLAVAAIVFVNTFDVQKYKPEIEQAVSENTGRTLTLGGDMDASVFPWVGVKLLDVHFSNPKGFGQADMVSVDRFEVRLKLLPLLFGKVEIKTFVLDRPEIYLEKSKTGQLNWVGIGKPDNATPKKKSSPKTPGESPSSKPLPIQSLYVDTFSITNGKVSYVDQVSGKKKQISDFNLSVANISLENPVTISMSAKFDGQPVSLKGSAGPLGKDPAKGTLLFDLVLSALDELDVKLKGSIAEPAGNQNMDIEVAVNPFSPRKIFKALGQEFPVKTKDPAALTNIAFNARIKGTKDQVAVSQGVLKLDDTTMAFEASAKEFDRPNLAFDLKLDTMDLDRYLPESKPAKASDGTDSGKKTSDKVAKKKTDYTPLRKLLLDGKVAAQKIIAHGAVLENLLVKVDAKNGIISMDPARADLYSGNFSSRVNVNVQKDQPDTALSIVGKNIQTGPLLKDAMKKELIEGTLNADIGLSMSGDAPPEIKKTLNGKGELLFVDGAIVGIDLANAVRNVKVNLGLAEKVEEKPRTDFAELKMPFTAKDGLVNTKGTSLASPLLRVLVNGDVDLVKELMDLRVDPKFVATLKGQGDTKQRSGLMVPVLITGSFAQPKVRPDLKSVLSGEKDAGIQDLKKAIGTKEDQEKKLESAKEDVKKQIKGFLPGLMKQ